MISVLKARQLTTENRLEKRKDEELNLRKIIHDKIDCEIEDCGYSTYIPYDTSKRILSFLEVNELVDNIFLDSDYKYKVRSDGIWISWKE